MVLLNRRFSRYLYAKRAFLVAVSSEDFIALPISEHTLEIFSNFAKE